MQNQIAVFRTLIVLGLVLSIVGSIIDLVMPGLLPESLTKAYEAYAASDAPMTAIIVAGIVSIGLLVLAVIATVGLLVLQPWARTLALWSTAVSFLLYPLLGAVLQSGLALMLNSIALTLWGAALAMTFYSDLKSRFQRPAS